MRRFSTCAFVIAVLALVAAPAAPAQVETARPIKIKVPKRKVEKFKGQVLSANNHQMIVRSRKNTTIVRTFSYTPEVRAKMQKIIDAGGYQYGDRVEVHHEAGSDVAIKIKGKPSKPL